MQYGNSDNGDGLCGKLIRTQDSGQNQEDFLGEEEGDEEQHSWNRLVEVEMPFVGVERVREEEGLLLLGPTLHLDQGEDVVDSQGEAKGVCQANEVHAEGVDEDAGDWDVDEEHEDVGDHGDVGDPHSQKPSPLQVDLTVDQNCGNGGSHEARG